MTRVKLLRDNNGSRAANPINVDESTPALISRPLPCLRFRPVVRVDGARLSHHSRIDDATDRGANYQPTFGFGMIVLFGVGPDSQSGTGCAIGIFAGLARHAGAGHDKTPVT